MRFDDFTGTSSGIIFGASGGVTEAMIRYTYHRLTGNSPTKKLLNYEPVRGLADIKEAKLKIKDMGNAISDMTRQYINPNTNEPTVVPAKHYVGMLDRTTESFIDTVTQSQYLVVLYN